MREASVDAGKPSSSAAPPGPDTRPLAAFSARNTLSRSIASTSLARKHAAIVVRHAGRRSATLLYRRSNLPGPTLATSPAPGPTLAPA